MRISVATIAADTGISRSTLYAWIKSAQIEPGMLEYALVKRTDWSIINSNNIGIAIMQGLSGSFGIVLAVPITVLLAVAAYTGGGARAEGKHEE